MKKLLLNVYIIGLSFAEWYDQGDGWVIFGGNVTASGVANGVYGESASLTGYGGSLMLMVII